MCEPNPDSLKEAKSRAKNMKIRVNFYEGDIFASPQRKYDVICYNFALHYIFETNTLFETSLLAIKNRMKPGGQFIGIIPNSDKIIMNTPVKDDLGNYFLMKNTSSGNFGEKLYVHLADTPYYADGPKVEPIAHKDMLFTRLEDLGFTLTLWEDLKGTRFRIYIVNLGLCIRNNFHVIKDSPQPHVIFAFGFSNINSGTNSITRVIHFLFLQ